MFYIPHFVNTAYHTITYCDTARLWKRLYEYMLLMFKYITPNHQCLPNKLYKDKAQ